MLRKILFAIAVVALFGVSALAHEDWPGTWVERPPTSIPDGIVPVQIRMVMWADIFFADEERNFLHLRQLQGNSYWDCVTLKVCVNFPGLMVKAKVNDLHKLERIPNALGETGPCPWFLSLNYLGHPLIWNQDSTEMWLFREYLTGEEVSISLCVRVDDVDPQSHQYTGATDEVAEVLLTMMPTVEYTSITPPPDVMGP